MTGTGGYKRHRKHNKVHDLPQDVRDELDERLADTGITYVEIATWLEQEGYEISKSTIGRYALESRKLAGRLMETQVKMRELVKLVAHSGQDDEALTEGAIQIATGKLTERIALIEEEMDDLPPEKAIDLMIKLSRAKAYKDKVYSDLRGEYERAYENFKAAFRAELADKYPDIVARLEEIANSTIGKVGQESG